MFFQLWDDSGSWGAQNNDPGLAGGSDRARSGRKKIRGQPGVPHELPAGWEEEEKVEWKSGRKAEGGQPTRTLGTLSYYSDCF